MLNRVKTLKRDHRDQQHCTVGGVRHKGNVLLVAAVED